MTWTPKVGDLVVYSAYSLISHMLVNRRLVEVVKVTKAGYVYIKGALDSRFEPGDGFYREHISKKYRPTQFFTRLHHATPEQIATLPRTPMEGNAYAKTLKEKL